MRLIHRHVECRAVLSGPPSEPEIDNVEAYDEDRGECGEWAPVCSHPRLRADVESVFAAFYARYAEEWESAECQRTWDYRLDALLVRPKPMGAYLGLHYPKGA